MSKLKYLLVLLIAFSLMGFLCDDKEDDSAQARLYNDSSYGCVITGADYGSASWRGTLNPGEYSEYFNISGSHPLTLYWIYGSTEVYATTDSSFDEPDAGEKYTVRVNNYYYNDCSGWTIYPPQDPDKANSAGFAVEVEE